MFRDLGPVRRRPQGVFDGLGCRVHRAHVYLAHGRYQAKFAIRPFRATRVVQTGRRRRLFGLSAQVLGAQMDAKHVFRRGRNHRRRYFQRSALGIDDSVVFSFDQIRSVRRRGRDAFGHSVERVHDRPQPRSCLPDVRDVFPRIVEPPFPAVVQDVIQHDAAVHAYFFALHGVEHGIRNFAIARSEFANHWTAPGVVVGLSASDG